MDGLSSICSGLGILEEDDNGNPIGYAKGEYCSDNLKDLLRFLRRDDPEKRDVFKQICRWNIVGKDLLPIIEYYQDDRSLVLNTVKVLVFLTMPVEPTSVDIPQQIEYLWGLKAAITASHAIPVIVSLLESPLENLENESFTEDDWKLVQLVLTLFRNFLAIQDILPHQKAGGLATQFLSLRDRFLELLFQENVMDLILVLGQHAGGPHGYLRQDNLLLLEIIYYIFKGQEPELIVKSYVKGSKVEEGTENSVTSLQSIIKEEQEKRKLTRLHSSSCFSKFTGTYTRVNLDGSKALFKGNPCAGDALLKAHKNHRGPSKRTIWNHEGLPSTRNQILELLYQFTGQFLMAGYNVLMQSIREDIDKDIQQIQSSDIVIFFYVARFVSSFQYYKCLNSESSSDVDKEASVTCNSGSAFFGGSICGPIAETLNESMFLMVVSKWRYAFEGLKQTNDYTFLSAAGSLMKTMIRMLDLVLKQSPEDSIEPQTARVLLYKLFYDQTEEGMTQFLLNLIKSFDTHKQSKSELADLVEIMHVIIRLMENLEARGTLRVSKKARKKKTKKATNKNENAQNEVEVEVEVGGSTCVDGATTHNKVAGSTLEESVDVSMSEKEILTNQDFDGEEDASIRDPLLVDESVSKPGYLGRNTTEVEGRNIDDDNDRVYGTGDSSGDEQVLMTDEVDLKVSSLVSALANNKIIQNLCWLLKFYQSNSISTNHYILVMLRRICDDLELSPMLYQLSLLTIFYDILEEQKSRPGKQYENIVTFLSSLVRRMLRKMKSYPLLFVEALFWKTRKECHYINCGSMLNELNSIKSGNGGGQSGAKSGESDFSGGNKWVRRSIADALGDDDYAVSDKDSQEEDDFRQGKESTNPFLNEEIAGCETSDRKGHSVEDEPHRMLKRGKGSILDDELEGRVKDLYEKYKDDSDFCQLIAGELDSNGGISKMQVSKKLKQLGLKVPAKRKIQRSGASTRLMDNYADVSSVTSQEHLPITEENSSSRKPKHSRKGVYAFTAEQEQKIIDLFNQFKDQKRCCYMIANALDEAGKISSIRVSRKLKQLGLLVPKKKRTDANIHLKDAGFSDISSEDAGESDDETLLSLRNRGKHKRNASLTDEKRSQKIARKLSDDISDDELLSVFAKSKKMSSKNDDEELMVDPIEKSSAENNSDGSDTDVAERNEYNQMGASEKDKAVLNNFSNPEPIETDSPNASVGNSSEKSGYSQHSTFDDELVDELPDFDENKVADFTQESSVSRRRLRMIIDFDDDDE